MWCPHPAGWGYHMLEEFDTPTSSRPAIETVSAYLCFGQYFLFWLVLGQISGTKNGHEWVLESSKQKVWTQQI